MLWGGSLGTLKSANVTSHREKGPNCRVAIDNSERLITMVSDKHGLKDQVAGKFKEVKGKLTNDKGEQAEGKIQKTFGKAKDKAQDVKDELRDKE